MADERKLNEQPSINKDYYYYHYYCLLYVWRFNASFQTVTTSPG